MEENDNNNDNKEVKEESNNNDKEDGMEISNNKNDKEEYNNLVRELGSWIDDEFLKTLIHTNFGNEVDIVDHDIQSAVNAGDNYLSTLYKTTVRYTNRDSDEIVTKKFMIKGVPPSQTVVDMIEDMGVFQNEIFMYDKYLPAMRYIMKQYFPIHTPNVTPNCYKCARKNTIVMEDLGETNYKMAKREIQLDFQHSSAAFESMAQFHALSVKVFEENPEFIEPLATDMYLDKQAFDSFIVGAFPAFAKAVENWDECAHMVPLINNMGRAIDEKVMIQILKPSLYLNVLNHGDTWVNNVMFRYNNDGSVNHAKFVDFQMTRYSSPIPDILYFLYTSVQVDVFIEKTNLLLQIYHSTLLKSLQLLDITTDYTFEKFIEEFEDRLSFGLFALVTVKPVVLAQSKVDISIDEEENVHPLTANFKNPLYKDSTIEILLNLESIGYLNRIDENLQKFLQTKLNGSTRSHSETIHLQEHQNFLDRILASVKKIMNEPMCT